MSYFNVLNSASLIEYRLNKKGRIIRGYNDCLALGLAYIKTFKDENYEFPFKTWLKMPFIKNEDFINQLYQHYQSENTVEVLHRFLEELDLSIVSSGVQDGDIIIREGKPDNLCVTLVAHGQEYGVNSTSKTIEVMDLPIFDRNIIVIGRIQ